MLLWVIRAFYVVILAGTAARITSDYGNLLGLENSWLASALLFGGIMGTGLLAAKTDQQHFSRLFWAARRQSTQPSVEPRVWANHHHVGRRSGPGSFFSRDNDRLVLYLRQHIAADKSRLQIHYSLC